jgi:hypothetical protein
MKREKRAIEANWFLDASPGWQESSVRVGFDREATNEPNPEGEWDDDGTAASGLS